MNFFKTAKFPSFLYLLVLVFWNYNLLTSFRGDSLMKELGVAFLVLSLGTSALGFALFRFIVKKNKTKNLAFTSILLIPLVLFVFYYSSTIYFSTFSTEKWSNNKGARYLMVDDLRNKHSFENLYKKDVIKLLGKDDSDAELNEKDFEPEIGQSKSSLTYYIRDERSFYNFHYEYRIITFDENEKFLGIEGMDCLS